MDAFIKTVMKEHVGEVRLDVIRDARDELEMLNISGQRNVSAFIERVTEDNPVMSLDYLRSAATIDAYVVGAKLGDIDTEKITNSGRIHTVTYGQLVDTATGKLFRLRQRLQDHYDAMRKESIVEQALKESVQLKIKG